MKKNTLTKLVALATVLLVSVGTIAGSTVAWFTDTEYAINTIQSGSLDIGLQYMTKNMYSAENFDDSWATVEPNTQMFNKDALYEPGYTEVVFLKVANIGDLDLKYQLSAQAADLVKGESLIVDTAEGEGDKVLELSDYLKMAAFKLDTEDGTISAQVGALFNGTTDDDGNATSGRAKARALIGDTQAAGDGSEILYLSKGDMVMDTDGTTPLAHKTSTFPIYRVDLLTKLADDGATLEADIGELKAGTTGEDGTAVEGDSEVIGLVLYMPEEVGNEANNRGDEKPQIELGIFLEAAQLMSEEDSYGSDYDADASFANSSLNTVERIPVEGTADFPAGNSGQYTVTTAKQLKNVIEYGDSNSNGVVSVFLGNSFATGEVTDIAVEKNSVYLAFPHIESYKNVLTIDENLTFDIAEGRQLEIASQNTSYEAEEKITGQLTLKGDGQAKLLNDVDYETIVVEGNVEVTLENATAEELILKGGTVTIPAKTTTDKYMDFPNTEIELAGGTLIIEGGSYHNAFVIPENMPTEKLVITGGSFTNYAFGETTGEGEEATSTFKLVDYVDTEKYNITLTGAWWEITAKTA